MDTFTAVWQRPNGDLIYDHFLASSWEDAEQEAEGMALPDEEVFDLTDGVRAGYPDAVRVFKLAACETQHVVLDPERLYAFYYVEGCQGCQNLSPDA